MTSTERRPRWTERLQPGNWTLPVKLVAVVAVPTLLALGLGGLRISDQSRTAASFDRAERIVEIEQQVTGLAVRLQDERSQVVQFVAVRNRQDDTALRAAFDATDAARADALKVQDAAIAEDAQADTPLLNGGTTGALRQVENQYFRLVQLRRQVLTGANPAGDLVSQYSDVIAPLLVFDNALTRQLSDAKIAGLSQAKGALGDAREQVSATESLVAVVIAQNQLQVEQGDDLRSADSRLASATAVIRSVLTDDQQTRYTAFTGPAETERQQLLQSALTRGRAGLPIAIDPAAWATASTTVLGQIDEAENGVRDELRTTSSAQQDAAANTAGFNSALLLLTLLLAGAVVWLVGRALILPLRLLRRTALDVAERRLPEAVQRMRDGSVPDITVEPVPVTTREEIGQVARAFDAVHSQAVRLAAEQATLQANVSSMFTNLSRRSQTLVERQLQLIEQLESNEQDPEQLSNLFALDHLATRMRRNSENLLVLSGTDLAKRAAPPVPLVDVLRAAVSEVEQYQRVVVQTPPQVEIAGRVATDLVHVLSELLDNSTSFSAPDTQVVISSSQAPDGSVQISVVDRGVGMSGPEMADANVRLESAGAVDVSASRRMGLFVVGRLASRHGLGVRLGASEPAVGMTASVTVPVRLLSLAGGATNQIPRRPLDGGGRPGRPEPAPPQRGPVQPERQAPLSAFVAGSDGPSMGGGPPAGAPTTGAAPLRGRLTNGNGSSGPTGGSSDDGLPVRRPGQFLAKGPSAATPAPLDPEQAADRSPAAERPDVRIEQALDSSDHQPVSGALNGKAAVGAAPTATPAEQPDRGGGAARPPASPADKVDAHDEADESPRPPTAAAEPAHSDTTAPADSPRTEALPVRKSEHRLAEERPPAPARPADRPEHQPARPGVPQPADSQPADPQPADPQPADPQPADPQPARPPRPAAPAVRAAASVDAPAPAPEGLFASAVPSISEPDAPIPPRAAQDRDERFERGETTPIFEEIASAWFRSNRLPPVSYEEETGRPDVSSSGTTDGEQHANTPPIAPRRPAPAAQPLPRRPVPAGRSSTRPPGLNPTDAGPAGSNTALPAREKQDREAQGRPAPSRPTPGERRPDPVPVASAVFASPADEGWRLSASVAEPSGDGLTAAGLPKRRPRARLVPGAASNPAGTATATTSTTTRTAEEVRGRLSSYQQGVRQGREARRRPDAGPPPDSTFDAGNEETR